MSKPRPTRPRQHQRTLVSLRAGAGADADAGAAAGVSRLAAAAMVLLGCTAAQAQYKVVAPDGRVTYTDRTGAVAEGSRITPLRPGLVGVGASDAPPALPTALRAVVARFPVTLLTSSDCEPCGRARQLLRQRGVPYSERSVGSDADAEALQRQTGGRTVPALLVGQQVLRGLLDADWQQTLDLAGYPRESALPRGWQPPAVRALAGAASAAGTAASSAGDEGSDPSRRASVGTPSAPVTRPSERASPGIRF